MQGSLPSEFRDTNSNLNRPRTRSSSRSSSNSSSEFETEYQIINRIISSAEQSVRSSVLPSLPSLSPISSSESGSSNSGSSSSPLSSSNSDSVSSVSISISEFESKMSGVVGSNSGSNNNSSAAGGNININPPVVQPVAMPMPFYFPVQIPTFKAEKSQNVEIFLQQYEGMAAQARFTPEMKAACFINYLGGDLVLGYWDSLNAEEKADYDEIRQAFLAQFRKVKPDPAEAFTKLNNRKQKWYSENIKKSEKVADYFYDLKQLAMHCVGLRPEELVRIAYSNLHKDFRKELKLSTTVGITIYYSWYYYL